MFCSVILLPVPMRQSLSLELELHWLPASQGVLHFCPQRCWGFRWARGHWGFEPKHSRLYSINILTHLSSPQQLALSYFLYMFLRSGRNNSGCKNLRGILKIPVLEQTCPLPRIILNLGLKKITWTMERNFENLLLPINS